VKVAADEVLRGPDLPEGYGWHPRTVEWWLVWRRSPQAQTFTDTDWSFLIDTAMLHSAMWSGDEKLAAEVRLRAAKFGATPEDRARLKLEVDSVATAAKPAGSRRSSSNDPRSRLKLVDGQTA
jgi:hypothetical protein